MVLIVVGVIGVNFFPVMPGTIVSPKSRILALRFGPSGVRGPAYFFLFDGFSLVP